MTRYKLVRSYDPKKVEELKSKWPSSDDWKAIEKVATYLERSRLNDYVYLMDKKSRWLRFNLMGGVFRGIGLAIGFSLLGAVAFLILQQVVTLNLPVISDFIADLLYLVEQNQQIRP